MKSRITHYLNLSIALLFLTLFTNCQKEETIVTEDIKLEEQQESVLERTNFHQLQTDSKFVAAYTKFNKDIDELNQKSVTSKSSGKGYDFTLDTTIINSLKKGDIATYTVRIQRDKPIPDTFENVVLKNENGKIDAFLFSYTQTLPASEAQAHSGIHFKGNINVEKIDPSSLFSKYNECVAIYGSVCTWEEGQDCEGTPHTAGPNCTPSCVKNTYIGQACFGGGPSTSLQVDWGNNNNPEPVGGNDYVGTSPIDSPCGDKVHGCAKIPHKRLANKLEIYDPKTIKHLEDNPILVADIEKFLGDNNDSQDAKAFAKEAVKGLAKFNINEYPGKEIGFPFKWWLNNDFIINSGNFNIDEGKPNAKEAVLFALYPGQALLHIENSIVALDKAAELVTNGTLTGIEDGKADALRHSYWNALGTTEFGSTLMKWFADAHEWGKSGLSTKMDFYNNHQGRIIGKSLKATSSDEEILIEVSKALTNGKLKYISSNNLIFTNQ